MGDGTVLVDKQGFEKGACSQGGWAVFISVSHIKRCKCKKYIDTSHMTCQAGEHGFKDFLPSHAQVKHSGSRLTVERK